MKKIVVILISFISISVLAGEGHSHGHGHGHGHSHSEIKKEKTADIGKYHVTRLIKAGKIDPTWKDSQYDKSVKKKFGKKTEWVVTFDNDKGVKGKKLYIFLKLSGEFIAANFTGK